MQLNRNRQMIAVTTLLSLSVVASGYSVKTGPSSGGGVTAEPHLGHAGWTSTVPRFKLASHSAIIPAVDWEDKKVQHMFQEPPIARLSVAASGAPTDESAREKREEAAQRESFDRHERAVIHGSLGSPHEGQGLETDLPVTVAEDSVEKDHARYSVHAFASRVVMPATGVFLLCTLVGGAISSWKYTRLIPESAATVIFSVTLGLVIRRMLDEGWLSLEGFTLASASVLNLLFLPVIIFNSGWALNSGDFLSQFEYILIFAIFGTIISTLFIGYTSQFLADMGYHNVDSLRENLVFAALISAVDPVATLSTYGALSIDKIQPLLNTMVFGESVINDAVAIVLFSMINRTPLDQLDLAASGMEVGYLLFGSMFFGTIVAGVFIFMMRLAMLPGHTVAEIVYVYMCAYFIFAFAESLHFSGIIANLFAGIIFRQYGAQHLEHEGEHTLTEYFETSAHMMDTAVFILCGTSTALIKSYRGVVFGAISVVLCFIARAISVPTCAAASNALKSVESEPNKITWKHQVMMWHGGLRGGIALVLALEIDAGWCKNKGTILNATFIVICVLLLLLGSTTEILLGQLGMLEPAEPPATQEDVIEDGPIKNKSFSGVSETRKSTSTLLDAAVVTAWSRRTYFKFFTYVDLLLMYVLVGDPEDNAIKRQEKAAMAGAIRLVPKKRRANA